MLKDTDNYSYITTKSKRRFAEFIQEMRENELHQYHSILSGFWQIVYKDAHVSKINGISLAYDGDKAIGVAMSFSSLVWGCRITCYVKPEYRKLGIGSILVKKLVTKKVIDSGAHQFPIGFPSYGREVT